jgi:hypothetical protein
MAQLKILIGFGTNERSSGQVEVTDLRPDTALLVQMGADEAFNELL